MDNGFSSCAAPAFCCGPGISIYAGVCVSHQSQGSCRVIGYCGNSFWLGMKLKSRGTRVEQFPAVRNTVRRKTQVARGQRITIIVESKLIYELRRHT